MAKSQNKVAKRNRDRVHRNKSVAQDRGERLRVIHGKTLNTLKQTQPTKARSKQTLGWRRHHRVGRRRDGEPGRFDNGRFIVDSPDDELRQQFLEIAELAGEDW